MPVNVTQQTIMAIVAVVAILLVGSTVSQSRANDDDPIKALGGKCSRIFGFNEPHNGKAVSKSDNQRPDGLVNLVAVYQSKGTHFDSDEDRVDVRRDPFGNDYLAVYDGHSGHRVSSMLKRRAIKEFIWPVIGAHEAQLNQSHKLDYSLLESELKEAVAKLDSEAISGSGGSTLNMVINTRGYLIALNVGHSRSIMLDTGYQTMALTEDHRPGSPRERQRIARSGVQVNIRLHRDDATRLVSQLAGDDLEVSRSLGDANIKLASGALIGQPDVFIYSKATSQGNKPSMVVVASDALWDFVTNEQATDIIMRYLCKSPTLRPPMGMEGALSELGKLARQRGTRDDITIVGAVLDSDLCKRNNHGPRHDGTIATSIGAPLS